MKKFVLFFLVAILVTSVALAGNREKLSISSQISHDKTTGKIQVDKEKVKAKAAGLKPVAGSFENVKEVPLETQSVGGVSNIGSRQLIGSDSKNSGRKNKSYVPRLQDEPTLTVSPTSIDLIAEPGQTIVETITVTGTSLTDSVTVTLADNNGLYTIDKTSFSIAEAEAGATVTVTFSAPQSMGSFRAQVSFTCDSLSAKTYLYGAVGEKGSAYSHYLDITKFSTIGNGNWYENYVTHAYNWTENVSGNYSWLTIPAFLGYYGWAIEDHYWSGISNNLTVWRMTSWTASDVFQGSDYFHTEVEDGDNYSLIIGPSVESSEDVPTNTNSYYAIYRVTNCTQVKAYVYNYTGTSSSYPTFLQIYEMTENADGTLTMSDTSTDYKTSTTAGSLVTLTSSTLDASKIYFVAVGGYRGFILEVAFKTPYLEIAGTLSDIEFVNPDDASVVYNGSAQRPAVRVLDNNNNELTIGTDYILTYTNIINPGTATITATGKGHYMGSLNKTFTITKAPLPDISSWIQIEGNDILYDGEPHGVTITKNNFGTATITYTDTETGVSTTSPPIEPGTYQVDVAFAESECYLGGTINDVVTFTIYAMNDEDWSSMMALYNGTDGPNWNKTIDMSNVIYARQLIDNNMATIKKGRITSLNLSNMGLVGEIPIEGVYFTALQSLNISNNNLYGNISSFVEPMTSLTTLNVSNNGISELYPPLSANVTNVTIGQQYIPSCQLSIDLKTVDKDELIASIPNIFLYSVNNRDYNSNVTATISAPDNWVGRFLLSNGEFTYQNYSSDNTFKGLSGETYPLEFWNVETSANGVVNLILTFDTGDADFNGAVNVIDLQAIINKIFGVFDSSRPFNYTAANVIVDERLNVQDVVGEVNLLLAQDGNTSKLMQTKAPGSQNQSIVSDAYLYWYNNVLYLSSRQDIAALDISLSGNGEISWNLKDYGLTVSNSNNHIVAYSLSGATIPSGVTAIATAENDAAPEIINAVLSDIDANEVSVNFNSGIITGVDDLINNSDVKIFAAEGGRVMMATSQYLTNVEWQVITIDGRMIAAGNEQNINKDFTTLVSGLNAGVYIVTVYADGKPVSTAKILMQ